MPVLGPAQSRSSQERQPACQHRAASAGPRRLQAWVLPCQKPEKPPPLPGSTLEHPYKACGPPLTPPAPVAGPRDGWGVAQVCWPGFNMPWLFPHLWPQPGGAWRLAPRPRCRLREDLPDGLSVEDGRLVRMGMVGRGGGSAFRFWSLWISLVEI